MRCERCQGTGWEIVRYFVSTETHKAPCGDCGGSGQQHCCDGICAQPDTPSTEAYEANLKAWADVEMFSPSRAEIDSDGRSDQKPNG